jgi:transposase
MTVKNRHTTRQLLALAKAEKNKHLAVRIQAIALAKQGFGCPQIVQMTSYSRRTVQRWIARYNQADIKGLIDEPRTGRPTKLSVDKHKQFCERVDVGPCDATPTLYGKDIQQILERNFGVIYTLDGVYKLLHRLGYSCLKPRPRHEKADPELQETFKKTLQERWKQSPRSIRINAYGCGLKMKPALVNKGH